MICLRGVAYSSACLTFGLSSSRFFGFFGLELKPRFGHLAARRLVERDSRAALERAGHGVGQVVDEVEVAGLEVGDHRGGVRVVRERHGRRLGLRPVEVRVGLEDRRALGLELADRVRAARDHREFLLREVRLEAGALRSDMLLPDVPGQHVELLEVRERRRDRVGVFEHELGGVRRRCALDAVELAGQKRGRARGVLELGVDRPDRVRGGERDAVRPFASAAQLERPGEAVGRMRPARCPVALQFEPRAVLHELRVQHPERVDRLRHRTPRTGSASRCSRSCRSAGSIPRRRARTARPRRRYPHRRQHDSREGDGHQASGGLARTAVAPARW